MQKHAKLLVIGFLTLFLVSCVTYLPEYQPLGVPAPAPTQSSNSSYQQPNYQQGDPYQTVSSPDQKEIRQQEYSSYHSSANTPPAPPKKTYPTAVPIPGKAGYVFNPYNNNAVYVQGIAAGKTVRDPEDPNTDHKFIVP